MAYNCMQFQTLPGDCVLLDALTYAAAFASKTPGQLRYLCISLSALVCMWFLIPKIMRKNALFLVGPIFSHCIALCTCVRYPFPSTCLQIQLVLLFALELSEGYRVAASVCGSPLDGSTLDIIRLDHPPHSAHGNACNSRNWRAFIQKRIEVSLCFRR